MAEDKLATVRAKRKPRRLTVKQEAFVAELFKNEFNATQAAIAAGYAKKNAHVEGSKLLRLPKVSELVEEHRAALKAKRIMQVDEAMERLTVIARGDISRVATWSGKSVTLKDLSELTPDDIYLIDSLAEEPETRGKVEKDAAIKIKLVDRLVPLQAILRAHGAAGGARVTVGGGGSRGSVSIEGDGDSGTIVILTLPDNGRGDGPPPLAPIPVKGGVIDG